MLIYTIFLISSILIIWFETEAFVEYMQLFRIPFFKINEYIKEKNNDCTLDYHTFLITHYNTFFVRLITCPICTSFWLTVICYILNNIMFLECPIIFICSILIYYIFKCITK